MKKITPVLIVERIEDSLPFWCDRLGFARQAEVPHGEALGFVILTAGTAELMLQSRASVAADVPALAADRYRTALFIEVEDLAPIRRAVTGRPTLFEERTTPYGAREVGVRDPEGNPVIFASFQK
jgi:catechol 2,3-dioxygenase-like lactoylglutathione lyase family enzyme